MRLQVATMPIVVFLAWRIVINHAVLGKFLAWWSASCLLLSRSFMFRFWFTTVMFHHASIQVYYCHRSASCLLHVTFVSYQKNPLDITVCLLSSCNCSFFFQFTIVVFFCLIQSYWVSKIRYCLPLVWPYTQNRMIHVTDYTNTFFYYRDPLVIFSQRFLKFFWVNRSNCVSTDSQHIFFPLLIRTHWTHTYVYIHMYVS